MRSIRGWCICMRTLITIATLLALTTSNASAGGFKADKPPDVNVSGKVTDPQGQPVKGALVVLSDRETGLKLQAKTNKNGLFKIDHERTDFESLQVIPPQGSGLAQAILSEIPADEARHMLVSLKPGVQITGKIVSGQRPLKNVTVRVISKTKDVVHDGGETRTNGKGEFVLTITPGDKIIEVTDIQDNAVVGLFRRKQLVTTSGALPTISIPRNQTAGIEK